MSVHVESPAATLKKLLEGNSIARFGDGECKIMEGQKEFVYFQYGNDELASELRTIIGSSRSASLVGLFNATCESVRMRPAIKSWHERLSLLASKDREYYSTLVTRLDSYPSLGTEEWFDRTAMLWYEKRVTLIANGIRSITPQMLLEEGADHVDFIRCSPKNAYSEIDMLEKRAVSRRNHVVIICAGMTATCLAERLANRGHQALDLGHLGRFWRRYHDLPVWRSIHDESARGLFDKNGSVVGNPT